MAQDFFLRVPTPGGGYEYVRVDTTRITRDLVTQLHTRMPNKGGPTRFFPVSGGHLTGLDITDVSSLSNTLREVLPTYRPSFEELGQGGMQTLQALLDALNLQPVFEAIARGEVMVAAREWEGILHTMLAGALAQAQELHHKENHVSGVTAGIEQITDAFAANDGARLRLYDEVVAGSLLLIRAVEGLERIERDLSVLEQTTGQTLDRWRERLMIETDPFAVARSFFEGSGGDIGFNLHTFNFTRTPAAFVGNEPDTVLAQLHLDECTGAIEEVMREWQALRGRVETEVVPNQMVITRLCADLAKGSKAIRDYRRLFGITHRPPFQLEPIQGKITPDQFDRALLIADDHRWGPATTQSRVEGLASRIIARLGQPHLPIPLERMIQEARRFLANAKETLARKEDPPEPKKSPGLDEEDSTEMTVTSLDPRRAQEIYEMVRCVGFVITANNYFLAASTIRAMLDILRFMSLITPAEATGYRQRVSELSKRPGERLVCRESRNVTRLRKTSPATWIVYETKGQPRLKMSVAGESRINELFTRHNISVEEIKQGHEGRRKEQEALHQARKASGGTSS